MPRRGSRVRISSSAPFHFKRRFIIATSTLTKLAPTQVELEIPISPEALKVAEDRAFRELAKKAKLPGFRPGKIPRRVFEQTYGAQSITDRAMEDVVPEEYAKAVREHDLQPVDRPTMELLPEEAGKPARIKAVVEVRPQIELGAYKGLELQSSVQAVSDEDVARSLESLARERAVLVPAEREARLGDVVTLDYEGKIDGTPFDGGTATGQATELDEARFIPGFASGIAGMKPGETKDVTATFPQEYQQADLAGKDAIFTVTLHEVKERELPALDDEFAKAASQSQTLDELKADIRTRLESVAATKAKRDLGNAAVDRLIETHEFPLPATLVDREVESMLSDTASFAQRMGLSFDDYLKAVEKTADGLRAEYRPDAERRVKGTLLLEAVARAENIRATPADVQAELAGLAEQYKAPVEKIREALGGNLAPLMDGIVRQKTVEFLVAQAKVSESN